MLVLVLAFHKILVPYNSASPRYLVMCSVYYVYKEAYGCVTLKTHQNLERTANMEYAHLLFTGTYTSIEMCTASIDIKASTRLIMIFFLCEQTTNLA